MSNVIQISRRAGTEMSTRSWSHVSPQNRRGVGPAGIKKSADLEAWLEEHLQFKGHASAPGPITDFL